MKIIHHEINKHELFWQRKNETTVLVTCIDNMQHMLM